MTISVKTNNGITTKQYEYNSLDDNKLLSLIGEEQDRFALSELYGRYKHSLGSFLHRGMPDTNLIDEIYNDVMLTVWKKASSFRGESKVSTWIFSIARRVRMNHHRKEVKHTAISTEELTHESPPETAFSINGIVQSAITKLSAPHRMVIELAYFHGYSMSEIATIVDCPKNTVKTRLFHARNNLKITIEKAIQLN